MLCRYPKMVAIYSIGKSVENRQLWVTRISNEVAFSRKGNQQKRKQLKPMVKIVANMHGNEVLNFSTKILVVNGFTKKIRSVDFFCNFLHGSRFCAIMSARVETGTSQCNCKVTGRTRARKIFQTITRELISSSF